MRRREEVRGERVRGIQFCKHSFYVNLELCGILLFKVFVALCERTLKSLQAEYPLTIPLT